MQLLPLPDSAHIARPIPQLRSELLATRNSYGRAQWISESVHFLGTDSEIRRTSAADRSRCWSAFLTARRRWTTAPAVERTFLPAECAAVFAAGECVCPAGMKRPARCAPTVGMIAKMRTRNRRGGLQRRPTLEPARATGRLGSLEHPSTGAAHFREPAWTDVCR
jgi:hypothetical protein